jgi:DNA ligase 1
MRRFAALCLALASTTSSTRKTEALVAYFRAAPPEDAALALAALLGRRGRRPVTTTLLRTWACEESGVPPWLFDACYESVGDLGETLATLVPDRPEPDASLPSLRQFVDESVRSLVGASTERARAIVTEAWRRLTSDERFIYHKLIGGSFRMGVAHGIVVRAVSDVSGLDVATITHRLMGAFAKAVDGTVEPSADQWTALIHRDESDSLPTRPYPFCLASPLDGEPEELGTIDGWLVERKFDGIRCQLLHRSGGTAVVSRGEERIDGSFPELVALAKRLPEGTVLDGEVLLVERASVGEGMRILPFARLQTRLNAKRGAWKAEPGLFELERVHFIAYDLLEADGIDDRQRPLGERRKRLTALVTTLNDDDLSLSPALALTSWSEARSERERSRDLGVEGLMLKRLDGAYGVGRERAAGWWKWKVDPYTIDAVLIAAQPGSGRRANLLTDYTFAIWRDEPSGPELVTIAKAYSGLTDAEIAQVDRQVRSTTKAKRGALRFVEPTMVFELGFEGLERSARHKAGIALRFPRILRWRQDKPPAEADRVGTLEGLLERARAMEPLLPPADGT